jgi:hypothetical protein
MYPRTGEILYRGACIGAGVVAALVVIGIMLNIGHENGAAIVRTLTVAALAWGAGRTALHFLAGR